MKLIETLAGYSDANVSGVLVLFEHEAQRAGVTGTPAFFINGVPLIGAQPEHAFETLIREQLLASSSLH